MPCLRVMDLAWAAASEGRPYLELSSDWRLRELAPRLGKDAGGI